MREFKQLTLKWYFTLDNVLWSYGKVVMYGFRGTNPASAFTLQCIYRRVYRSFDNSRDTANNRVHCTLVGLTHMTNRRKHVTQMTTSERTVIESYAHSISGWQGLDNPHIAERKAKWSVHDTTILDALRYGSIVEVHANNYPEIRFVLRHVQGNKAICVCASKQGRVITVWVNNASDNHFTLNRSDYQWHVNLETVFCTVQSRRK